MLEKRKSIRIFYGFLILLTLINLIQAYSTELILDEAYYWYFSKNLSWGYFDHPPMVALLVKIGAFLFGGELGVRFFAGFLFSGTIYVLWQLIDDDLKYKNVVLFCLLAASVALLNVYGFFMLPDTPLLFFAAIFLWGYKRFIQNESIISILLLTLGMAGMMYSKYHAILLIGFIVLSNLKLFIRPKFWLASILALVLYTPHLYWLYENNFISLKYHLIERANSSYKLNFTLDYLVSFFVVPGFAFPLIFWSFFKHKSKSVFDKGMLTIVYGIFIFFLISSFNRRTQAQWPVLTLLPLLVITFTYALSHPKFKKWLFITSSISFVAICFLRFAIVHEKISPITYESHGNKKWVDELKEKSGGRPAIFRNAYADASLYSFYSGIDAMSLNGYTFRQNQFDFDDSEEKFQHKNVVYLSSLKDADSAFGYIRNFKKRTWRGIFIDDFSSCRKLVVSLDEMKEDSITLKIKNPYNEKINFEELEFFGLTLTKKKAVIDTLAINLHKKLQQSVIPPKSSIQIKAKLNERFKLKNAPFLRITVRENNLPMGFQGNTISLKK